MTKEEILAAAGYPNTEDGIAAFYNEYNTPQKFFAKHGGSLSGAPHNGQPTADQFFDYGSHANDQLNIPMSNPYYLQDGGSIVNYLASKNQNFSKEARKKLAEEMGIQGYDFSAEKNIELLNLLKSKEGAPAKESKSKPVVTKKVSSDNKDKMKQFLSKTQTKSKTASKPAVEVHHLKKDSKTPKVVKQGERKPNVVKNYNINTNYNIPSESTGVKAPLLKLPSKKEAKNASKVNTDNISVNGMRLPQSGMVVDKRNNQAYYFGNEGETGTFPVLTGKNPNLNRNDYGVEYLENNPMLRNTPRGYYLLDVPEIDKPNVKKQRVYNDAGTIDQGSYYDYLMKDYAGRYRDLIPINAFGVPAPITQNLGFHGTYSNNAKNPNDPEFRRREALYSSKDPKRRCTSFGCVNSQYASYDEIYKAFPTRDTLLVLDPKNKDDLRLLNIAKKRIEQKEQGGAYFGGPTRPYEYGGDTPEMLHGGYNSPMNYGSFPAVEWGGALDSSNEDSYPMMDDGGSNLAKIIKAASKSMKKKTGGASTIQGANQNHLEELNNRFRSFIQNNVYNDMLKKEEQAAMQAINPYAMMDMQDENEEQYQAKYGLSTYRKRGEKQPKDDVSIDFAKTLPDLFPTGRDYSQYLPSDIKSQYMMSNADYAKMADLNQRIKAGTFKLNENGFEGTPEWGPMARLLGKTGRKMFGPKSVTYKFTGRPKTLITDADRAAEAAKAKDLGTFKPGTMTKTAGSGIGAMELEELERQQAGPSFYYPKKESLLKKPYWAGMESDPENFMNYSDQYIQKQAALPIDDGSLMQKAKGYYSPFAQFFTPSTYGPGYSSENFEVDPSKLRTTPDAATARKMQEFIKNNKKYGGGLNKYQGGGLTQEQYDQLMQMYTAAEQASQSGSKKNQPTLEFQQAFHQNPVTKQIAERLLQERQKAGTPTAYGRTLGAGNEYSLKSNEDEYFGQTTKQYLSELQKLKPQSQPTATPAPDLMTPKQANLNTGVTANIAQSNIPQLTSTIPVPTMTPNKVSLNSNITGNIAQTTPQLGSSASSTDLNKPFEMKSRQVKLDTNQPAEIKPAKPFEYKEGPEETVESKIKRKTKGIGKAIARYAPGAANWIASNLEKKPKLDPMQQQPITFGNRGTYRDAEGMGELRPDQLVTGTRTEGFGADYTGKYGGALPMALSGLEVKMQPGLYGTNGNRQFSLPTQIDSQKYAQQPTEVRNTLLPVAREGANLEAEKGETALVNIDGIPAHFKIGGKRHSEGGTPLNLPDNSFIFSDTASMKIKDPYILAQFGMAPKKSGYTPAEIAKKYDINKYRKILSDPNSEDLERKTAERMIANCNMKLAKLAMAQESIKGFPQGFPVAAMPYLTENNIQPDDLLPAQEQGQEDMADEDMGVSRYGGNIIAQFKKYGGLTEYQTRGQVQEELNRMHQNEADIERRVQQARKEKQLAEGYGNIKSGVQATLDAYKQRRAEAEYRAKNPTGVDKFIQYFDTDVLSDLLPWDFNPGSASKKAELNAKLRQLGKVEDLNEDIALQEKLLNKITTPGYTLSRSDFMQMGVPGYQDLQGYGYTVPGTPAKKSVVSKPAVKKTEAKKQQVVTTTPKNTIKDIEVVKSKPATKVKTQTQTDEPDFDNMSVEEIDAWIEQNSK